jgi:hypothetical protein
MAWTSAQDVLDRWVGENKPTNNDIIDVLISDAEAIILSEFPAIQERLDEATLPINIVKMVVSHMTSRVLRNPENVTYLQQNVGSFSQAKNYGNEPTGLYLTNDEKKLLSPNIQKGKAFSINMAPNMLNTDPWAWDNLGVWSYKND